jgi:hypothetical protein
MLWKNRSRTLKREKQKETGSAIRTMDGGHGVPIRSLVHFQLYKEPLIRDGGIGVISFSQQPLDLSSDKDPGLRKHSNYRTIIRSRNGNIVMLLSGCACGHQDENVRAAGQLLSELGLGDKNDLRKELSKYRRVDFVFAGQTVERRILEPTEDIVPLPSPT